MLCFVVCNNRVQGFWKQLFRSPKDYNMRALRRVAKKCLRLWDSGTVVFWPVQRTGGTMSIELLSGYARTGTMILRTALCTAIIDQATCPSDKRLERAMTS